MTPGYFSVINNPLKAGRTFTDADIRQAPLVMIINETLARAAFGNENPIGKRIALLRRRARTSRIGRPWSASSPTSSRAAPRNRRGRSSTCR